MPIEIRETKIIPAAGDAIVEMLISDEPAGGRDPAFSLFLRVKPDFPNLPARTILTTFQVFAVQAAQKQLAEILVTLRKSLEKSAEKPSPDPID